MDGHLKDYLKKLNKSSVDLFRSLDTASTTVFRARLIDKRSTFLTKPTQWGKVL